MIVISNTMRWSTLKLKLGKVFCFLSRCIRNRCQKWQNDWLSWDPALSRFCTNFLLSVSYLGSTCSASGHITVMLHCIWCSCSLRVWPAQPACCSRCVCACTRYTYGAYWRMWMVHLQEGVVTLLNLHILTYFTESFLFQILGCKNWFHNNFL